jgi:hypothetical protein
MPTEVPVFTRLLVPLIVLANLVPRIAAADVLFSESLGEKVGSSALIAVAEFVRAEGPSPYTNAHPPTAVLRVTRAIRGSAVGDLVRRADWGKAPKPQGRQKSPMPPVPPTAEELRAWAEAPVPLPAAGTPFLLLLRGKAAAEQEGHAALLMGSGYISYPDIVATPDARLIERVVGMVTFSIEVQPDGDQHVEAGAPVVFTLTVHNDSKAPARFALASLRTSVAKPNFDHIDVAPPKVSAEMSLPVVTLAPDATQTLRMDLNALYPGVFAEPGDYALLMEFPAQGGERVERRIEYIEASLFNACGGASHVLRAHVTVEGAGTTAMAVLTDPVAVRQNGERLPARVPWAVVGLLPTGERRILCVTDHKITFAGRDTPEARNQLRTLLEADSRDWWSHAEDADPRFAPPPNEYGPPGALRQDALNRRLIELP